MSRFYEALRQASESLRGGREGSEAGELDLSAVLNQAASASAEPAVLPVLEVVSRPAAEPFPADTLPQNGALGILTEAVLDKKARVIPNAVEPMILEHYRLLRTRLIQEQTERPFRSLLVTSSGPKEGKTITALNLALACAMIPSYKVLVLDGDIRSGGLTRWLHIDDRPGLSNLFDGSARMDEVVLESAEIPFYFIGRGKSELPPPELLHLGAERKYVEKLSGHFDLVLVDSPPVSLVADPQLLAKSCDAVLLVARAFYTSRSALQKVGRDFHQFRVVGTVLNGGGSGGGYRRYRSYYPKA